MASVMIRIGRSNAFGDSAPSLFGVLLILGFVWLLGGCAHEPRRAGDTLGGESFIPVLFSYADAHASTVCVAGSFNGWSSTSRCMVRKNGAWSLQISLPVGRYQYLLVIDGRVWKPDPGALLAEDSGFGGENSILVVE